MDKTRRNLLKGSVALVAAGSIADKAAAATPKNVSGNALPPEYKVIKGQIIENPDVRMGFARCWGCYDNCSVRVRIDKKSETVQRVSGNPYCPNNTYQPETLSTPVEQALLNLAKADGTQRATTCGRGTAAGDAVNSKQRITQVLKRVGKRGELRWQTVSYEQALAEIINGGDLFGEGHVDGLAAIHQPDKLACPVDPLFGPASKQFLISYNSEVQIRTNLLKRFATQYRASIGKKSAYCGAQQRIGIQRAFKSAVFAGAVHAHPDIDFEAGADGCKFGIYLGTTPGNSGNSLNTLGAQLAKARTDYGYEYVCVDPILRNASNYATGGEWVPILPGRDTPFLFGMMRHIFETERYNKRHLENVSEEAAKADGELHYTNAAYLVIQSEGHPDQNKFLRNEEGIPLVMSDGSLKPVSRVYHGELLVDTTLTVNGEEVKVISALALLQQEAFKTEMAEYARQTGISVDNIRAIADKFTSVGRKAAIMLSTASNSADGTITGWATATLNTLIGSHHAKGGAGYSFGPVGGMTGAYDLANIPGGYGKKDQGVSLNREGKYELSAEYKRKLSQGQNPYPATDPWPETAPVENTAEMLASHINARPYKLKAFMTWRANVLYGASGLPEEVYQGFKEPHGEFGIPLIIGVVDQISTTAMYADYLIPDLVHLEEAAIDRHWGNERKGVSASGHLLEPKTVKAKDGQNVCMEKFLIDVALKLGLKGFGDQAVKKRDGTFAPLTSEHQWAAYALANCASNVADRLPVATERDLALTSTRFALRNVYPHISKEEAGLVERLISRGGYYDESPRYDGDFQANRPSLCLNVYNEGLTESIDCYSGKHRVGIPTYCPNTFYNGDAWSKHWPESEYPVLMSSYKSTFRSPWSVSYDRTLEFSPTNFVYMHQKTGAKLGLKDNDRVTVESAIQRPAEGILKLVDDMVEGAISIATGFGHVAYGASDIQIDDQVIPGDERRGSGVSVNPIIPNDPTRNGPAPLVDVHTYCTCRHGVPVKVMKA